MSQQRFTTCEASEALVYKQSHFSGSGADMLPRDDPDPPYIMQRGQPKALLRCRALYGTNLVSGYLGPGKKKKRKEKKKKKR